MGYMDFYSNIRNPLDDTVAKTVLTDLDLKTKIKKKLNHLILTLK